MNVHNVNLAVLAGHGNKEKDAFELRYSLFYGTAFCLAKDLFLTAAHVFKDAQGDSEVALARLTLGNFQAQTVHDFELFDSIDLALLYCPGLMAEILPFNFSPLDFLVDVFSFGYPFGSEHPFYYLRAFKGHVVTRRRLSSLNGLPPGYEVSFVPPPGLSGAPLLTLLPDKSPVISGIILQHHTAEYRERKMDLGLALDIEELLTLESRIVGGSIAEILFQQPRLERKPKHQ